MRKFSEKCGDVGLETCLLFYTREASAGQLPFCIAERRAAPRLVASVRFGHSAALWQQPAVRQQEAKARRGRRRPAMAGWLSFTVSQVVITSVALGALKHSGAMQCAPLRACGTCPE